MLVHRWILYPSFLCYYIISEVIFMRCRTHLVFSNVVALGIIQPNNVKDLVVCMTAATVGGIVSDLDIRTSDKHKAVDLMVILFFSLLILGYYFDNKYNYGLFNMIGNSKYYLNVIGMFVFLGICFYGMHQPHRSFLHSFLGIFLLTGTLYYCFNVIWLPFLLGMLSHIFLDIFNKRPLRLLYPLKYGFSLKLCNYDSPVDTWVFIISIICLGLELYIL